MGHNKTITIHNMNVYIIGPVIMSFNHVGNVMSFDDCDVTFYHNITLKSNDSGLQVIYLISSYIKVMEYAIITLLKNKYRNYLIIMNSV